MANKYLWQAGLAIAVVGAASVGAIGIAAAAGGGDNTVRAAAQTTEPTSDNNDNDHRGPWGGPWGGGPWGGGRWGGAGLSGVLGANVTDMLHGEVVLAKEG